MACIVLLLFTLCAALHSSCGGLEAKHYKILDTLLTSYDKRVRPTGTDREDYGPVIVKVKMHIRAIDSVDIHRSIWTPQIYFIQTWMDDRLKYNSREIHSLEALPFHVWVPDTIFANAQSVKLHTGTQPQSKIRIHPNGKVYYSQKLSLTLGCPMDLGDYPFDTNMCEVRMESYFYSTNDIKLVWQDQWAATYDESIGLYDMSFTNISSSRVEVVTATGNYTLLIAGVTAKRSSYYYETTAYVPCALLVIIAWLCFFLDVHSTAARLSVVLVSMILMFMHSSRIHNSLPAVGYMKAIDIWTGTCFIFICMALVEIVLVSPGAKWNKGQSEEVCGNIGSSSKRSGLLNKIDIGFQILYAVAFIIFNISYWSIYPRADIF